MCTVRKLIFRYYRRNADVSKPGAGENIVGLNMHRPRDYADLEYYSRLSITMLSCKPFPNVGGIARAQQVGPGRSHGLANLPFCPYAMSLSFSVPSLLPSEHLMRSSRL